MQKRSFEILDRVYDPVMLDEHFPIRGGEKTTIGRSPQFLHRHNVLELGYCYEGCGVFIIDDNVYPFSAGDVSVIDAGMFHIAQTSGDQNSIWAFILVDPCRFTASLAPGSSFHDIAKLHKITHQPLIRQGEHQEISSTVWQILDEIQREDPFFEISVAGLIASLMVKLFRTAGQTTISSSHINNNAMERIAPVLQYIASHYMEQISIPELAELCCLSVAQLRRLFHLAVGQSPQSYLVRFRMGMSASMLNSTTLQILDIANKVGYSSLSGFNRHFKDHFKMSPREWRDL